MTVSKDYRSGAGVADSVTQISPGVTTVPISALRMGGSPRLDGENDEHIRVLAELDTPLPPIIVHRATMQVVDGMHRLRAAIMKEQNVINVRFFDGDEVDAFIMAVKANIAHGLPLTLADREAAATRIIKSHSERSDRWIASVIGLAPGTVASIRRQMKSEFGDMVAKARIGRDGKIRPLSSANGRMRAKGMLEEHPEASLRKIAEIAGISPGTVRDVKNRLQRGEDPVPGRQKDNELRGQSTEGRYVRETKRRGMSSRPQRSRESLLQALQRDPALRMSESGRALLRWIGARTGGPGELKALIDAVPPHCVYIVAQVARICAYEWLQVAEHLDENYSTNVPSQRASDQSLLRVTQNPSAELSAMRGVSNNQPSFRVNFFYREDFVYVYDELLTLGKMSSRS